MTTENYRGMIVGHRRVLEQTYVKDELQKEERAKQRATAFAKTDIEGIWLSVQDVLIQHFDSKKRLAGIELRLGDCGKFMRKRGLVYGLKIRDELYGGPRWACLRAKDKILCSMHQPMMYNTERFSYCGHSNPNGVDYTAKDMRDSFLDFMTIIVPAHALAGVEPVDMAEIDQAKTRRKIMAPA